MFDDEITLGNGWAVASQVADIAVLLHVASLPLPARAASVVVGVVIAGDPSTYAVALDVRAEEAVGIGWRQACLTLPALQPAELIGLLLPPSQPLCIPCKNDVEAVPHGMLVLALLLLELLHELCWLDFVVEVGLCDRPFQGHDYLVMNL